MRSARLLVDCAVRMAAPTLLVVQGCLVTCVVNLRDWLLVNIKRERSLMKLGSIVVLV